VLTPSVARSYLLLSLPDILYRPIPRDTNDYLLSFAAPFCLLRAVIDFEFFLVPMVSLMLQLPLGCLFADGFVRLGFFMEGGLLCALQK